MEVVTVYNNTSTSVAQDAQGDPFVSDELLQQFKIAMYVFVMAVICLFGVVSNIINIIVFAKMGLKDTVNITLMCLAVADGGSLLPLLWMGLCYNPLLAKQFPHLDFQGIQHLTGGLPHSGFTRIASWLTALVTFERYLCVAFPLKIKTLVTQKRTVGAIMTIVGVIAAGFVPLYSGLSLGPVFQPQMNRTVIGLVYAENGVELENWNTTYLTAAQLTAFAFIVICTLGLIQKIQSKRRWRKSTSSASTNETTSMRDRKVVKMIICISVIFSVTYTPFFIATALMLTYEEYSILGRYSNIFLVSWMFFFLLETINSSVNIFVYLKMSSKYKSTFLDLFKMNRRG